VWTLRGPRRLRLSLCEKWERNPAQGAPHATSVEPEGFKRDKTEIRRRVVTLQMQAETLGRADQKKKAERRKAKYRSQDLSGAKKQKSKGSPRSISRRSVSS